MPSARIDFRLVSRRGVLAGLAAGTGLIACDDTSFPTARTRDSGGGGVPSGEPIAPITSNDDFYVTSCCGTPEVDGALWSLTIDDGAGAEVTIDLAWLDEQALREREHTLECIGANEYNLAISNAVWTGLPLREVFETLGVTVPVTALEIVFTCADGYSTSLPVSDLDKPLWLVWRMNGVPLPAEHGYPVRLLVPGRYGMKNPKWIVGIRFSDTPYTGHWESYGWSQEATYRPNALVAQPGRRATVEAGPLRVQGMAFAGSDAVVRVEVRIDGGAWSEATMDYAPGADVWALWHIDWDAPAGDHVVQARCRTASGAASIDDPEGSDGLEGYDGSMEVEVEVV